MSSNDVIKPCHQMTSQTDEQSQFFNLSKLGLRWIVSYDEKKKHQYMV